MNRTGFSGPNVMSSCLIVVAAGVAITSLKWPFKTALFPLVISLCVLILAVSELLLNLFGKEKIDKKMVQVDFKLSEDVEEEVAFRRTLGAFAWIVGFFVLILLLGFSIAVALFVFVYVKFQGKERWALSILMAGSSWFFFWGLFIWLLDTPLYDGWIIRVLRSVGIG